MSTLESRLRRLEAKRGPSIPPVATVIETLADLGDEAEHERQAAEQKAAAGYVEGMPLLHVKRDIVDPPPWPRPGRQT